MSKQTQIQRTERAIELLSSDLTYVPNGEQRKVKEAFWLRFNESPTCSPSEVSLPVALRFVGDPRLERWFKQDGFKEWFRNQEEFRERAAILAHQAMDCIQEILIDHGASPSARIVAARLALEIAKKIPKNTQEVKFVDDQIGKMDKKQLQEFLTKNVHLLPSIQNIEGTTNPDLTSSESSDTLE